MHIGHHRSTEFAYSKKTRIPGFALILVLALLVSSCNLFGGGEDTDTKAPGNVTAIVTTPGDRSVTLAWNDPGDADLENIEVLHSPGSGAWLVVDAGTETATVTGLDNGTAYTFTVKAVDSSGNTSSGATATETPISDVDTTPPDEATNIQAVEGNRQITLSWDDPSDADFAYIHITHDQSGGTVPIYVQSGAQTVTIQELTNGQAYLFRLRTVDTNGNVSAGATYSSTPTAAVDSTAPDEVTVLDATEGDRSVTLSWQDPTTVDFHHAEITHDQAGGTDAIVIAKGALGAIIDGLVNGTAYTFTVKTVDASGNRSTGTQTTPTTPSVFTDTTPPGEAVILTAVPGLGSVTLTWNDPEDSDFHHIGITHDQTGGGTPRIVLKGVKAATLTGLAGGVVHSFTLTSYDANGNASDGVQTTATPTAPDTTAPLNVTVTGTTPGSGEVTIAWTDPEDVDFVDVAITHTGTGGTTPIIVAKGLGHATIAGLAADVEVTFTLVSRDSAGNASVGVQTAATPAGPDATPPDEVTALNASAGDGQVVLTWEDPTDADFNCIEITHDGTGGDTPRLVAKGIQTLTWSGLDNGSAYVFTVRTLDLSNNLSSGTTTASLTPSASSGDVTVTVTLTTPSDITIDFLGESLTLNKLTAASMTVQTTRTSATSYAWYLDGELIATATTNSVTIQSASLAVGLHTVGFVVEEGDLLYSSQFDFSVVNN